MAKARQLCTALAALAFVLALGGAGERGSMAMAQAEHRAGLVIQFADGSTQTFCVPFTGESITGLDLLLKTGLDVQVEAYGGMGAMVCKIGPDGCDYPQQPCVCLSYGVGGAYWSYHHLKEGTWRSSSTGAGGYKVHDGDVEGWAWSGGKPPALVPAFSRLCAVEPQATATPERATATRVPPTRAAATAERKPTATPTSPRPRATATAAASGRATETEQPQAPPVQTTPTIMVPPSYTATPEATLTLTPASTNTRTAEPTATQTAVQVPSPTQVAEEPTATFAARGGSTATSSESLARAAAIVVGLFTALGFVLWRVVVGARSRAT